MKQDCKKLKDVAAETEVQTRKIRQSVMSQDLFDELIKSIHEGGAILRGEKDPARAFMTEILDK